MTTGTAVDVVMPQMGVSVSEGTITKWFKSEGEEVAADESLLEISTDKVDTEVPSPSSGVLQQILAQEGETVPVGTKIAVIAPGGEAAEAPPEPATAEAAEEAEKAAGAEGETPTTAKVEDAAPAPAGEPEAEPAQAQEPEPAVEPAPEAAEAPAPPAAAEADGDGRGEGRFVSPVVARIASEHDVDVSQVEGTGRGGRVTKKDILQFIESGAPAKAEPQPEAQPAAQPAPTGTPAAPPAPAAAVAPSAPVGAGEHMEPMSAMRKGIAEHMRRSLDTAAHVTSSIEVDMTRIAAIRQKLKREWGEAYGVNPTYLAFVACAAAETLKDYPWINGEIRGDAIVTRNYVNLGFAVELADGKGLIVPVIRNAEGLNLLGMARAIADIAARAREKKLLPDEVQGGTFTITNPGGYGTFHGTPIINQPQSAILGTYAVVKRPWVVQDETGADAIAIRSIMNLTLTYDHRLVDGALAGRFLRDLRERLQNWEEPAD